MKKLKPMDIYIAEVPFEDIVGIKLRPALVMKITHHKTLVFKITSKYNKKSESVKSVYYPIKDWKEAGLKKPSYVDVHKLFPINTQLLIQRKPIGRLSALDIRELYSFIHNRKNNRN